MRATRNCNSSLCIRALQSFLLVRETLFNAYRHPHNQKIPSRTASTLCYSPELSTKALIRTVSQLLPVWKYLHPRLSPAVDTALVEYYRRALCFDDLTTDRT